MAGYDTPLINLVRKVLASSAPQARSRPAGVLRDWGGECSAGCGVRRARLDDLWDVTSRDPTACTNDANLAQPALRAEAGIGRGRRYVLGGTHIDDLYRRIGVPYIGVTRFLR